MDGKVRMHTMSLYVYVRPPHYQVANVRVFVARADELISAVGQHGALQLTSKK